MIPFLLILLVTVGLILYSAASWGFVFYKFYYWFVLSVFTGLPLPYISISQAIGLYLMISLVKTLPTRELKEDNYENSVGSDLIKSLILPWVVLLVGWLVMVTIM
jgi:hypothetical protein